MNYGKLVEIGDHVWVGKYAKVGKRAKISSNSIVGWHSIVSSLFEEPNAVIVGNPARAVKLNVNWDRLSPVNYLCGF